MDFCFLNTPIGCLQITCSNVGIRKIHWVNSLPPTLMPPVSEHLIEASNQIEAYFNGMLFSFSLPIDWTNQTPFFQSVWKILLDVPYGHTISYKEIALALGNANLVRAVGLANSRNPIPIVIPCHRCIASSGNLQGFIFGKDAKRLLLQLERKRLSTPNSLLF